MLACLAGSASKLLRAKVVLPPLKRPPRTKISCLKRRLLFAPQESQILPDVGLPAKKTRFTMASVIRTAAPDSSLSQGDCDRSTGDEYDVHCHRKRLQVHSHKKRLHASGRFQETVTRHLPKLSQPVTVPSRTTSGTDCPGQRRLEQIAMFYITAETCR